MELKRFIYSFPWILLFFIEINFRKCATSRAVVSRSHLEEGNSAMDIGFRKVSKLTILKSHRADV